MEECAITVIGAGVVGLAIAAELTQTYSDIVVLEQHGSFGQETSSRNSEVVHSGIYYPPGSLKARLCVEGAGMLYQFCEKHGIGHRRTGKLIVAADETETGAIEALARNGEKNGVAPITFISGQQARAMEPAVRAQAAIYLPQTGIVDSHGLMKQLYNRARAGGVMFAFNSRVEAMDRTAGGYEIRLEGESQKIVSRLVVNAAGLGSDRVAAMAGINLDREGYHLKYCKGSYFAYGKPSPVSMLIYPVPHTGLTGLGTHATIDLGGRLRFGPDVEYVDTIDYRVDGNKRDSFHASASKLIAGLEREAFQPDMAGMRPKLQGPGEGVRDFVISEESGKGLPGLINLIGIESPGLTSSLAIARVVAELAGRIQ